MGICLPGWDDDGIFMRRRRIDTGRLCLVFGQQRRHGSSSGGEAAERLGASRHAWKCQGVVFRLAERQPSGWLRSRWSRHGLGPCEPRWQLGGPAKPLPVGLPRLERLGIPFGWQRLVVPLDPPPLRQPRLSRSPQSVGQVIGEWRGWPTAPAPAGRGTRPSSPGRRGSAGRSGPAPHTSHPCIARPARR